jgi:hypothetical protein
MQDKRRMECMGCPYYEDFTRLCVTRFPSNINYMDFATCQSENYTNCLVYNVLQKKFNCKYLERCAEETVKSIPPLIKYFVEEENTMKLFREIIQKYCTSEVKHAQCANFKLFEQGIQPPIELLPNGKKVRISDILLKKEISID